MARSHDNIILRGSSGRIGQSVITRDGQLRSRPDVTSRQWSEEQKKHLTRFDQAKTYARQAISDPVLNGYYAKKAAKLHGLGAWHLAIRDFYYPPVIHEVSFRDFHEKSGDTIVIHAIDNFEVTRVWVRITGKGDKLIEEGEAVCKPFHVSWLYTLQQNTGRRREVKVTVSVSDLPGNITTAEYQRPFKVINTGQPAAWGPKKRLKSQLRPPRNEGSQTAT